MTPSGLKISEISCTRCSKCCILKEAVGNLYRLTDRDCPFLLRENGVGECMIYENRFSMKEFGNICVPIEEAIEYGDLPPTCAYVAGIKDYKTKVIDWMVT